MRRYAFFFVIAAALAHDAAAQLAVSTLGPTEAQACYKNARNERSRTLAPCDAALEAELSDLDRKSTLVNRGIIRNRRSELQAALGDFNAALKIDAALAEAFLNRGNTFYLAARYDRALADYEKALALEIDEPWAAWYNIGLVRDALQDAAGARAAYEQALALNPDFAPARKKLEPAPKG